jgi:AcrR family transcriptional regulator
MSPPTRRKRPERGASDVGRRILERARTGLFPGSYLALTMDKLAGDLGISKKTLYTHFRSKEALALAVMDDLHAEIRSRTAAVVGDRSAGFPAKLGRIIAIIGEYLGKVRPEFLDELEKYAPRVHDKFEEIRRTNIPLVFGQLLREGIRDGMVRPEIDPDFAAHFLAQIFNGLLHPTTVRRTGLNPHQTLLRGIALYYGGILTPAGYDAYRHQEPPPPSR